MAESHPGISSRPTEHRIDVGLGEYVYAQDKDDLGVTVSWTSSADLRTVLENLQDLELPKADESTVQFQAEAPVHDLSAGEVLQTAAAEPERVGLLRIQFPDFALVWQRTGEDAELQAGGYPDDGEAVAGFIAERTNTVNRESAKLFMCKLGTHAVASQVEWITAALYNGVLASEG